MLAGLITKVSAAAGLLLFLAACQSGPTRAPVLGQAFVGPAALNLRADIPLESKTVATVKHGDRLEILQRRRRFLRVRAPNGAEGWTDERQLLGASDMDNLKDLAKRAATMPAQGIATTYGDLRVYTQPSVHAPSFLVIKNGEKFSVLTHQITPRTDLPRTPLIPPVAKKPKLAKKPPKQPKYPLPPMPKPPGLPKDWLDLSKTDLSQEAPSSEEDRGEPTIPKDNWSLVRTASGQAGWVLTRRLIMAIPDEVAQYAEGHRIVSYFSLGTVADEDQKKDIWLWTTISGVNQPYDFDSFRVFIWSLRRHRYETAYIMRNIRGFAPVLLEEVNYSTGGARAKAASATIKYPGFSLCVEKQDGRRYRQEFALLVNIVRFAGERACEAPTPIEAFKQPAPLPATAPEEAPAREGLLQRLKKKLKSLRH